MFKYSLFVLGVIGGVLGIMIGFIFWVINSNLKVYVNIWSAILLGFVVLMIILFYTGGKDRIRQEKLMIASKQKMEDELAAKVLKKEDEK